MSDDLISRSALKKAMWDESHSIATFTECGTEETRFGLTASEIEEIIDNAPTVEQECYISGAQWDEFMKYIRKRPRGKLIIKNHMETCENCGSVMPMMNDYYRAKLRGCPYCLTEFTNLEDMRGKENE